MNVIENLFKSKFSIKRLKELSAPLNENMDEKKLTLFWTSYQNIYYIILFKTINTN